MRSGSFITLERGVEDLWEGQRMVKGCRSSRRYKSNLVIDIHNNPEHFGETVAAGIRECTHCAILTLRIVRLRR